MVDDPCEDLGSGGSSLNALLIAVERLCAQRGFSVLTEDVLSDSRILIANCGREYFPNRCGSAFMDLGKDAVTPTGYQIPLNVFVRQLAQLTTLAGHFPCGVWICGGDAFWQISNNTFFSEELLGDLSNQTLLAFTFNAHSSLAKTSGVYCIDNSGKITGIDYLSDKYENAKCVPLVMTVLFMPVPVATTFLSLHSVYPLSSCTYYGIDNGSPGLQLSIFFDFILAAADGIGKEAYIGAVDSDSRLTKAREILFRSFSGYSARVVYLNIEKYHYFQPASEENLISFLSLLNDKASNTSLDTVKQLYLPGLVSKSYSEKSLGECFLLNRTHIFQRWFSDISFVIRNQKDRCLIPIFRSICALAGSSPSPPISLIDHLHESCTEKYAENFVDRALSCIADVLAELSERKGGLRSGPAANPAFAIPIKMLCDGNICDGLSAMRSELNNWMSTPQKLIRAARHYEAAAQVFTRRNVRNFCLQHLPTVCEGRGLGRSVQANAACRVDVAGGWTDTPPITMQVSKSAVVNIAIMVDDKKPIECRVTPLFDMHGIYIKKLNLFLKSLEDIQNLSDKPSLPGSLICATLQASSFVGPEDSCLDDAFKKHFKNGVIGLEIFAQSSLPHGSGMGTSSILAAALLASLWTLMGVEFTNDNIYHGVLLVEQNLTTGGGWQDQVGGIAPGIKISHFCRDSQKVIVKQLSCTKAFVSSIDSRLILIYTGRTRLAKNLLQEVIRSWFSRDLHLTSTLNSLADTAEQCAQLMCQEKFPVAEVQRYHEDKKRIATGCEPAFVRSLIEDLQSNGFAECAWLAGAGGGGFLYVWLPPLVSKLDIQEYLHGKEVYRDLSVHSATVDMDPLQIQIL